MTVAKLRGARERKRRETGKYEGRKSHAEERPQVVAEAKRLRRARYSLREISKQLADMRHVNEKGQPFHLEPRAEVMRARVGVFSPVSHAGLRICLSLLFDPAAAAWSLAFTQFVWPAVFGFLLIGFLIFGVTQR